MSRILDRFNHVRGWTVPVLAIVLVAIAVLMTGYRRNPAKTENEEPAPKSAVENVVAPKAGPGLPERLAPAARRLWTGFKMFESEADVPWLEIISECQWSEQEIESLRAMHLMLQAFGDETAVGALPGGDANIIRRIVPMKLSAGYFRDGKVVFLNVILSKEKDTVFLSRVFTQQAFAGGVYHLHMTALRAALLTQATDLEPATLAAIEAEVERRQVEFCVRFRLALKQFPDAEKGQMLRDELEVLCPHAFKE